VKSLTVVAVLDADIDPAAVEAALASDDIDVVAFVHGLEDESDPLLDTPADVLVLACEEPSDAALSFLRSACGTHPDRPIVVLAGGAENGHVARVFEAGADDLIRVPDGEWWQTPELGGQLKFIVEKAMARRTGSQALANAGSGRMICVLGPKGGIGKTLTASNLTVALAATGASVTVVDVDLQFGDVGLALGLRPDRTAYDLARSGGSLDAEKLDAFLAVHSSGARALLAPKRPDEAGTVSAELLSTVYPLLRATSDYVIVDTPPGFTPEVIASIDSSSDICLVGMLDSLSLKNTKLGLETLELMGYGDEQIRLVLNRADSRVGITPADVAEILGRRPDILVPSAREVTRSVNEGAPIALSQPRSDAAKAFRSLAALYMPSGNGNGGRRQRTLLRMGRR
jgi:pilus assembly protein CpaE